jgi:hypothetical protein
VGGAAHDDWVGSFLSELVEIAGGRNVFGDLAGPSPQVAFEEVLRRDPEFISADPRPRKLVSNPLARTAGSARRPRAGDGYRAGGKAGRATWRGGGVDRPASAPGVIRERDWPRIAVLIAVSIAALAWGQLRSIRQNGACWRAEPDR